MIKPFQIVWELIEFGLQACVILGCTDPDACNWNEDANVDDGSCTYPTCVPFAVIGGGVINSCQSLENHLC